MPKENKELKKKEIVTIESVNDIGLSIRSHCRLPDIHFYTEYGSVLFWATTEDSDGIEHEALQYLTPEQAMKFAKAMENCAIQALKNL